MELPIGKKQRKEFWRAHIEASENHPGSIAAYCREHGIARSRMFYHRQMFLKQRSGFAEVKAVETPPKDLKPSSKAVAEPMIKKSQRLPDPQWLAALIRELSQ